MDITDYIFARREEVLVAGDYNGYRAHTTRKLHNIRKKLGQTTPKGRKYTSKPPISAEDVGQNVAYVSQSRSFSRSSSQGLMNNCLQERPSPPPECRTGMGSSDAHEINAFGGSNSKKNIRLCAASYHLAAKQSGWVRQPTGQPAGK